MPQTITCATCPLARPIEGNRFECTSAHKDSVTRGHWTSSADCDHALAQFELEQHLEQQALSVAPLPTTRIEVYAMPEKDVYIVYSYRPKYFTPAKYRVRYNGGGYWSCNCPHYQHRHDDFNFIDKHIAAVKQKLHSTSTKLTREPVTLTAARGFLAPTFMAWLGGAQLGYVRDQEEGEILANRYFNSERDRSVLREKIMASYSNKKVI